MVQAVYFYMRSQKDMHVEKFEGVHKEFHLYFFSIYLVFKTHFF